MTIFIINSIHAFEKKLKLLFINLFIYITMELN